MKIANPTERDFKDLEGGTPNLNREKYELANSISKIQKMGLKNPNLRNMNQKIQLKEIQKTDSKSRSDKYELENSAERDFKD